MDTQEDRKRLAEKQKTEQELFLEYLLDPFVTYDEAHQLSRLTAEAKHPIPSRTDRRERPSKGLVRGRA